MFHVESYLKTHSKIKFPLKCFKGLSKYYLETKHITVLISELET